MENYLEFFRHVMRKRIKPLRIMKLILMFLIIGSLQLSASVYSQNGQMNVQVSEMKLADLLWELHESSDIVFVYRTDDLEEISKVTLDLKNASITDILDEVLKDTHLEYKLDKNVVVIKKRELQQIIEDQNQQEKKIITGQVTDNNGVAMPGVSVVIKGSVIGTATDLDGHYSLTVKSDAKTLVFSFIGMETKEVVLTNETHINVVLKTAKSQLEEVVVTGYQEINKERFTGAGTVVSMNKLEEAPVVNVDNLLQNKIAGVNIQMSGTTGQATIRIRGTSSINGLQAPLWVIDGVIMESPVFRNVSDLNYSDPNSLFNSGIDGLSPTDISSITILKDASATAIYGTRASNGVIVVKTKSGKAGQLRINFNASSTYAQRFDVTDFDRMNSSERLQLSREMQDSPYVDAGLLKQYDSEYFRALDAYKSGEISLADYKRKIYAIEQTNTDWGKELYRNALSYQGNISASGGTQAASYYASIGYSKNNDNLKNKGYDRINALMKGTFRLGKRLTLETKLVTNQRKKYGYSGSVGSFQSPFMLSAGANRTYSAYDENGKPKFYDLVQSDTYKIPFSVVHELNNIENSVTAREMSGQMNFSLNFDKVIFSGLVSESFTSSLYNNIVNPNTYYVQRMRGVKDPDGTFHEDVIPRGGVFDNSNNYTQSSYYRGMVEVVPFDEESVHSLHISGGGEYRQSKYETYSTSGLGYMPDRAGKMQTVKEAFFSTQYDTGLRVDKSKSPLLSYFGILDYTYNEKYTIKATGRMDGSNLFGDQNQFVPLWSVGANWLLSKESCFADYTWIDRANIRGSYGYQGNVAPGFIPDLQLRVGDFNKFTEQMSLEIMQLENPDLRWEVTKTWNTGLDFSLFNYRLGGTVDLYSKQSEDLLASKPVSGVNGVTYGNVNWADVSNKGIELSLNGTPVKSDNFEFRVAATFSYNKNEVLSANNQNKAWSFVGRSPSNSKAMEGYPINALFSYRSAGLNEDGLAEYYTGEFDDEGNELTSTKFVSNFDALEFSGNLDNPYSGGLNMVFKFKKRLSLGIDLAFEAGGVRRMMPIMENFGGGMYPTPWENISKEFKNRWRQPGDEEKTNIPRFMTQSEWYSTGTSGSVNPPLLFDNSDQRVAKADFVKLRNVSLSYSFAPELLDRLKLTQMNVYIQGQNLYTLKDKKLKGLDPQHFYLSEPIPATITLGVNMSF